MVLYYVTHIWENHMHEEKGTNYGVEQGKGEGLTQGVFEHFEILPF